MRSRNITLKMILPIAFIVIFIFLPSVKAQDDIILQTTVSLPNELRVLRGIVGYVSDGIMPLITAAFNYATLDMTNMTNDLVVAGNRNATCPGRVGVGTSSPAYQLHIIGLNDTAHPNWNEGAFMYAAGAATPLGLWLTCPMDTSQGQTASPRGGNIGLVSYPNNFGNDNATGDLSIGVGQNGSLRFVTGGTTRLCVTLDATGCGSVGIGQDPSSPYTLDVNGTIHCQPRKRSDIRLKQNIQPIDNALDKILKLRGVSFEWKKAPDIASHGRHYGIVAQEAEKIVPEIIQSGSDGIKSADYDEILPILIEAVKERQKEIEILKKEVEGLERSR